MHELARVLPADKKPELRITGPSYQASSRSQTECPGLSAPTPGSYACFLSSHHSCLPAPGHVLREALTCRGEGQVQAQPGPRAQRCHLSGEMGPSQGNFSAQIESWRRDRRCPTDTCVLPPILQVGAWRSHTERRAKARSWTRVSRPPSSRAHSQQIALSPHLCPLEEMDGGKGRKGRKESRLVFKRSVLKKHFCLYHLPAPPLSHRLASGTTLVSLLHGPRGCRCHLSEPVRGRLAKKSDVEDSTAVLKKVNIEFHFWPLKELKTGTTPTFPAVSFTVAQRQKQPSVHRWGNGEIKCELFSTWWNTTQP